MTDDIKAKLESILANSDSSQVEKLMRLKSSGLAKGLTEEQKSLLVEAFLKTDTETLKKKLSSLDLSKLDLGSIKDKLG